MILLIVLCTLAPLASNFLLSIAADYTAPFHLFCLTHVPPGDAFEVTSALLCNSQIHSQALRDFLARAGLFHVVIIAKSHLVFLAALFDWITTRSRSAASRIFFALLFALFILALGFQAPLLRALLSIGCFYFSQEQKLNWDPGYILLLTAGTCLLLSPEWLESLSLLHSCGCAAAFLLARKFCSSIFHYVIAFCLSIPFLWGWGNIHPLAMVFSVLLTMPVLGLWYFCAIFSLFSVRLNAIWIDVFHLSLSSISRFFEPLQNGAPVDHLASSLLWFYFSILLISTRLMAWKRR